MNILPLQAQRFQAFALAGLNMAQIDGDQLAGFHQPGATGSIRVHTLLNNRWEWSLGLGFAQQGARRSVNDPVSAALDRIRLQTVEVPVMLHFNEWKFQLGAGLAYNRLISYRIIDALGQDASELYPLRNNQFSAALEASVFLKENTGFSFRWYRNLHNLQAGEGAPRWIGRTIALQAFLRL